MSVCVLLLFDVEIKKYKKKQTTTHLIQY